MMRADDFEWCGVGFLELRTPLHPRIHQSCPEERERKKLINELLVDLPFNWLEIVIRHLIAGSLIH